MLLWVFFDEVSDTLPVGETTEPIISKVPAWRRPTLPGPCGPSTIGAGGLNGRVRYGNVWFPSAIATKRISVKDDWSFKTDNERATFPA